VDKEAVDEIIFRSTNPRNRLILELMARGGMRIGEVLNLTPGDIQERTLTINNPQINYVPDIPGPALLFGQVQ
jgi:integrase